MTYRIFVNEDMVAENRKRFSEDEIARILLKRECDRLMESPLRSIVDIPAPNCPSGDPHDYYSEAPYWWPNPDNPDGPYVQHDGRRNPNRFTAHHGLTGHASGHALMLAIGACYLDEPAYAKRAVEHLWHFFVNEDTRMNPHLEYAQAIHGICHGRSIGIIDSSCFIEAVQAAWYLEFMGYTDEMEPVRQWFRAYLHWLNTSKNGLGEKNYTNNHASWWHTQAAAYAAFCQDIELLDEIYERFTTALLDVQMAEDGSFPAELRRTNSYSYSLYNLRALSLLCEIAHQNGTDLWHKESEKGNSMTKAFAFMKPYLFNAFKWKGQQIGGYFPGENEAIQLAGVRLNDEELRRMNHRRRSRLLPILPNSHTGPLYFLAGAKRERPVW